MAPTVRAVGVAANTATGGGTSLSLPLPGGTAATDGSEIWVALCESANEPLTFSGAWQSIGTGIASQPTGTNITALTLKWLRVAGGEAAPTVSGTGINHIVGRIVAISGCPTTGSPFSGTPVLGVDNTTGTAVAIAGMTTADADTRVFVAFSTGQDVASTANASGYTNANLTGIAEHMDNWSTTGNGGGFALASGVKATAGATGTTTATVGTGNTKAVATFALKPAPAANNIDKTGGGCGRGAGSGAKSRAFERTGSAAGSGAGSGARTVVATLPVRGEVSAAVNSANTLSVTLPIDTAVGDTVIISTGNNFYALTALTTPTSTAVASWTENLAARYDGGTNAGHHKLWRGVLTAGGAQTITVPWGASSDGQEERYAQAIVYVGDVSFDQAQPAAQAFATSWPASSVTAAAPPTSLIVVAGTATAVVNFSFPAGMTGLTERDVQTFATYRAAVEALTAGGASGTRSVGVTPAAAGWTVTATVKRTTAGATIDKTGGGAAGGAGSGAKTVASAATYTKTGAGAAGGAGSGGKVRVLDRTGSAAGIGAGSGAKTRAFDRTGAAAAVGAGSGARSRLLGDRTGSAAARGAGSGAKTVTAATVYSKTGAAAGQGAGSGAKIIGSAGAIDKTGSAAARGAGVGPKVVLGPTTVTKTGSAAGQGAGSGAKTVSSAAVYPKTGSGAGRGAGSGAKVFVPAGQIIKTGAGAARGAGSGSKVVASAAVYSKSGAAAAGGAGAGGKTIIRVYTKTGAGAAAGAGSGAKLVGPAVTMATGIRVTRVAAAPLAAVESVASPGSRVLRVASNHLAG